MYVRIRGGKGGSYTCLFLRHPIDQVDSPLHVYYTMDGWMMMMITPFAPLNAGSAKTLRHKNKMHSINDAKHPSTDGIFINRRRAPCSPRKGAKTSQIRQTFRHRFKLCFDYPNVLLVRIKSLQIRLKLKITTPV